MKKFLSILAVAAAALLGSSCMKLEPTEITTNYPIKGSVTVTLSGGSPYGTSTVVLTVNDSGSGKSYKITRNLKQGVTVDKVSINCMPAGFSVSASAYSIAGTEYYSGSASSVNCSESNAWNGKLNITLNKK